MKKQSYTSIRNYAFFCGMVLFLSLSTSCRSYKKKSSTCSAYRGYAVMEDLEKDSELVSCNLEECAI